MEVVYTRGAKTYGSAYMYATITYLRVNQRYLTESGVSNNVNLSRPVNYSRQVRGRNKVYSHRIE